MSQHNLTPGKIITYFFLAIAFLLSFFPLLYLFLTSVKPAHLLLVEPPKFLFKPNFNSYIDIFFGARYYRFYLNSIIVATTATVCTLALGSLGAFALAKNRFLGSRIFFFIILITRAYMPITTLIPMYEWGRYLNLLDTKIFLIILYTAFQLPLGLYILKNFFDAIPRDIFESAEIDGCSLLSLFFRITLPLSSTGLLAAGILIFVFNWNEFKFALVLTSIYARTAPVALKAYMESEASLHWAELSALGFCMTVPVLVFMILFSKYLVKGLLSGAVKG